MIYWVLFAILQVSGADAHVFSLNSECVEKRDQLAADPDVVALSDCAAVELKKATHGR